MQFFFRAAITASISHTFIFATLALICTYSCITNAGIDYTNTVHSKESAVGVKILKVGDRLLCASLIDLSKEETEINSIEEIEASEVIEITTTDNATFRVSKDQKFFVNDKWVEAQHLSLGDMLLRMDNMLVNITSIRTINEPTTLRYITLKDHNCYFIGENGVLVHNGPLMAVAGYWTTKVVCYTAAVAGTIATVVYAAPVAVAAGSAVGSAVSGAATAVGASAATAASAGASAGTATAFAVQGTGAVLTGGASMGATGTFLVGGSAALGSTAGTAIAASVTGTATAATLGTAALSATPGAASIASASTAAGGLATVVATVESWSVSIGTILALCPGP